MNVGENVKKLRELKNFTQQYMAERLEVSQKTYSNIEASGNNITVGLIDKIATVLDVTIHTIIELNVEAIFNNSNQTGDLNQLNTATFNNYLQDREVELMEKIIDEKNQQILQLQNIISSKDELIQEIRKG